MQERTVVKHEFQPKGDGTPPAEFELVRITENLARRSEREHWYLKSYKPEDRQVEVLGTFTRAGLARLIADAADWLSYVSDDE